MYHILICAKFAVVTFSEHYKRFHVIGVYTFFKANVFYTRLNGFCTLVYSFASVALGPS